MRTWLFFLTICFCRVHFASPIQDHQIDRVALLQLCSAFNIPEDAEIVAETQKHWLRKANQELWEISELSQGQRLFVLKWAREQGFFDPWEPVDIFYDKALILGAVTPRMQERLDSLIQLWNKGVRFQEIVWLTGDRPLDPKVDTLTDRCQTESEAAHILWKETFVPEQMRSLPVVFIPVPMKGEGVSQKRPNTEDTILAWVKHSPEPCKALFISNQPFCGYQFSVIKASLPKEFLFDVAGHGFDPTTHPRAAAVTLDSIGRWIYQENIVAKSAKEL